MSRVRREYFVRLCARIVILFIAFYLLLFRPESYRVMDGWSFFSVPSPFHILWVLWVFDMCIQLIPAGRAFYISIGSQKVFATHFRPIREKISKSTLRGYVTSTTRAAYKVMILWAALIAFIGVLYFAGVITRPVLLFISVVFYVCDLICVLIWCPFRLIMKNKCCTTCRIFNWDHLMMFSPLIFAGGFYAWSLVLMSIVNFAVWEACAILYPVRFCLMTNAALRCSECTDKLCTQYCQKLRKREKK